MTKKFYVDTAIWIDLYEDRTDYKNESLGSFALKLVGFIKLKMYKLIITDILINELEMRYALAEIKGMFKPFESITENILSTRNQREEAARIAKIRDIPPGDVLHAILARDNKLILITRDKHFRKLRDISKHYKPEDIIGDA